MDGILDDAQNGRWTRVLKRDGVTVWKRDANALDTTAPFSVKARVVCPVPADILTELLSTRDYDVVKVYNPTVAGGHDIEYEPSIRERVTYIVTKPVWPLRARDFVCRMRHVRRGNADLIVNSPTTHTAAAEKRGLVRGRLAGIHLIEERGNGECLYTMVHQIDPAGAAPRKLVNWFALRKPYAYMQQLRELAQHRHALDEQAKARERERIEAAQPFRKFPTNKWGEELWLMALKGAGKLANAIAI